MNDFFKTLKMAFSLVASLVGLVACESSSPFHKKDGEWYFESHTLGVSVTTPLTALNARFARVGDRIFYREDGVEGADSATFVALDDHYAVRDVASFEVLEYGFTRDRMRGYNRLIEIAGSDGTSFTALDSDYAKDAKHAWYSYLDNDPKTGRMRSASLDIKGADAASFATKTAGYAIDAKRVYYKGRAISALPDGFECLTPSYAKNINEVLYYGKIINGADAATFHVLQPAHDGADAADAKSRYLEGERL